MTSDIHKSNRGNCRQVSPTITSPFRNNQPVGLTHSKTAKCSLRRMAMNRSCRKSHTRFTRATLKATVTVQAETLAPCRWAAAGPGRSAGGRWRGPVHHTPARQMPPVWRAPEGPEGQAAVPMGGGGAWPGFETTRRAKLAARTALGRAATHGHTEQPGLPGPDGARNTSGATSNTTIRPATPRQAYKNRHPQSDVGLWWS